MSFIEWLLAQVAREPTDPTRDVARLLIADRLFCQQPSTARNHRGLRWHLVHVHHADAETLEALDRAYLAYRAVYPRRRRSV